VSIWASIQLRIERGGVENVKVWYSVENDETPFLLNERYPPIHLSPDHIYI